VASFIQFFGLPALQPESGAGRRFERIRAISDTLKQGAEIEHQWLVCRPFSL